MDNYTYIDYDEKKLDEIREKIFNFFHTLKNILKFSLKFNENPEFKQPSLIDSYLDILSKFELKIDEYYGEKFYTDDPKDFKLLGWMDKVERNEYTPYINSDKKSDKLHETEILLLDSSKAEKLLGWKQILSIDETIKLLCDWYLEENVNYDFDVNQINYYFKRVKEKTE